MDTTLDRIEEELGESLKRECELKGINMNNYSPSKQTYTPWYKLPMKVEFGRMHPGSYGNFHLWSRRIKIDPIQSDPAATLYHESIHADVAPFTTGIKLVALGVILYCAYEMLRLERGDATQMLYPLAKSALSLGTSLAVRHGEECLVQLRERKVFGRKE